MNHRRRLPKNRKSVTHKVRMGGFKLFFTVGLYEDGQPGELFIHTIEDGDGKFDDGGALIGLAESWAIAVSMLLQSGWTVEELLAKFGGVQFPPRGFTDNPDIHSGTSVVDYMMKWMRLRFVDNAKVRV